MGDDKKRCEKCGSPECRGAEECIERQATNHVIDLLTKTHGTDVAEFWAWEMTSMPAGFPSNEQLGQGVRMAFSPRAAADEARAENMKAIDAAMAEAESRANAGEEDAVGDAL